MPPPPLPHPDFSHVSTFSNIPNCTDSIWGRSPRVASSTSPSSFLSLPLFHQAREYRFEIVSIGGLRIRIFINATQRKIRRIDSVILLSEESRIEIFLFFTLSFQFATKIESNRIETRVRFPREEWLKSWDWRQTRFTSMRASSPAWVCCASTFTQLLSLSLSLRVVAGSLSSSPPGLPL